MWMTTWAELGIPGFVIWISLMLSCLVSLHRLKVRAKTRADTAWIVPYADMIQAAFVGFMVSGTFVDNAYFEFYYFVIAATIILKEVTASMSERSVQGPVLGNEKPVYAVAHQNWRAREPI
jgi:hypothetical protein